MISNIPQKEINMAYATVAGLSNTYAICRKRTSSVELIAVSIPGRMDRTIAKKISRNIKGVRPSHSHGGVILN